MWLRQARSVGDFAPGRSRCGVQLRHLRQPAAYCRTFRDQLCLHMDGIVGVLDVPGGLAEYVCLPAQQLIALPDMA